MPLTAIFGKDPAFGIKFPKKKNYVTQRNGQRRDVGTSPKADER
ncbi:hypothetical protein BD94_1626 [Elizabethkingia anophelis NUHP1]|uniref:Uncharacterized protein n=2 Tax=Elizabethkingia anophelis TaxID=1117645 RepID=A0A455ZIM3_9FLAO|nr:hypothetical protein BD94_1626 [Elizabethkingia anophelis NUHP1]DAC76622.1 TPA_exp: hypothetical protein [Elizabethkingia anophelis]